MDPNVPQSIARWPNVPDVYGWLLLDRRGGWRIRGESVTHPGFVRFIGRNYACDDRGCWFFQNGPQRVFVDLDYTPWIYVDADGGGTLRTHTGRAVRALHAAGLDESGNLVMLSEHGIGCLADRDLPRWLDALENADGAPFSWEAWQETGTAVRPGASLRFGGRSVPLERMTAAELPRRFSFRQRPAPPAN